MKLIFLGAPGSGKGTHAEYVSEWLSIPTISTGAILREAIAAGTALGISAKAYMDKGALVPDEVVKGIIKERLSQKDCSGGYILDGYPRTIPQAEFLESIGALVDFVVNIDVADETIVRRMTGRRVCEGCSATYHLEYKPSSKGELCSACGAKLIQRSDDSADTVKSRLSVYHEQTAPLKDYYNKKGILLTVRGREEVKDTAAAVRSAILEAAKSSPDSERLCAKLPAAK